MLQFIRSMFSSRLGVVLTVGFLILIALAFASADVSTSGGFGGVAGGDRVATVGKTRVDTGELSQAATSALENMKAEDPRMSMEGFIARGGLEQVLEQLIDQTAISEFGRIHGIVASDRLVDSEIAKMPAFRGADGNFSQDAFRQVLKQQGVSEALVREEIRNGLVARQVLVPAAFGAVASREQVLQYTALLRERRTGAIALLPSAAFAPQSPPTDAELKAFYTKNSSRYIRPERRVVRFAVFDETALRSVAAPTDAEIAARYNADKAQYAGQETRRITQLIAPTEAAAKAIAAEVAAGKTLEAAASSKGLSTSNLGSITRDALTQQASKPVADAVFAATQGAIAAPARSALGWHVARVDAIEKRAERPLAQVRGEIVEQLTAEKRRQAINDLSARIEEEIGNGAALADIAKELGLTPQSTQPITADGAVYGKAGEQAPAVLARVLQTAFAMERENEAQLAEVEAGKTFVIFDVTQIEASAPAPLAEIREDVITAVMLEKGSGGAKAAAEKVAAQARKGTDLGEAMASLGMQLPPVDRATMGREDLARAGQAVPPPLALMFSMAEGTVKMLPAPNSRGWYVVALKDIEPGKIDPADTIIPAAQRELGTVAGREYAEALRRAIRAEVGVEKNNAAVNAVRKQLTGGN
jgi:peptidyl-prolyl cis-trans isomerase D